MTTANASCVRNASMTRCMQSICRSSNSLGRPTARRSSDWSDQQQGGFLQHNRCRIDRFAHDPRTEFEAWQNGKLRKTVSSRNIKGLLSVELHVRHPISVSMSSAMCNVGAEHGPTSRSVHGVARHASSVCTSLKECEL